MPDPLSINRREAIAALAALASSRGAAAAAAMQSWPLRTAEPTGIHDVAPAPDGGVWFTAQRSGHLGWFDPKSGRSELVALGPGSSPHGVVQGPDKAAWLTDSGLNAIVRVGWPGREIRRFALPDGAPNANLNTAAFDGDGRLWFTGQAGFVGHVDPRRGDPQAGHWRAWKLPASGNQGPRPYAVYVDERDIVWVSDFGGNAIWRFEPATERFERFGFARDGAGVRQIHGRPGEVWLPESGTEHISVIRTG